MEGSDKTSYRLVGIAMSAYRPLPGNRDVLGHGYTISYDNWCVTHVYCVSCVSYTSCIDDVTVI